MQLADASLGELPAVRRFSPTQATFQFSALMFLATAMTFVACAFLLTGMRPGISRLLLLLASGSLLMPAIVTAGLVIETVGRNAADKPAMLARKIRLAVVLFGVSLMIALTAAIMREQEPQRTLLETQRESARFLFGLDDLSEVKLVNYVKANGRVEAEFGVGGRRVSVIVTPQAATD